MNKHLIRLGHGTVVMLGVMAITAIIVGLVGLAVLYPWTGFISGGLGFLAMAYFAGVTICDE